jgi:single-strand DNA-binding protein
VKQHRFVSKRLTNVYKRIQTFKLRLTNIPFAALFYEITSFVSFINQKIKIMSNMRNQVRLIGNLGKDPEIRDISETKKVAKFSLATNETYLNDKGEKVTETQWHQIVCWGKLAGLTEKYLVKGSEIALEGKLTTRVFNDKDGNRRFITEVIGTDLVFLGKKNAQAA